MEDKLICKICGRDVKDGDYITDHKGVIVCKCCAYDQIDENIKKVSLSMAAMIASIDAVSNAARTMCNVANEIFKEQK